MRRILIMAIFVVALLGGAARSASATEVGYNRNFGLGFVLGDPTGFVGKYWVANANALDFGVGFYGYGWGICDNNNGGCNGGFQNFSFNADYLWQSNLVKGQAQLDWHIGVGGRAFVWNNGNRGYVAAGPRMPLGLDLMFNNPAFLEVFFEIAPALYIGPGTWFSIDGGLGVRFYF